jgi:hypothetical protein
MSAFSKYWIACAMAALTGAFWMGTPAPANAQISIGFGGMPFRFHIGPGYRGRHYGGRRHKARAGSDTEETGAPSKEKSDKVLASLGAPSSAQQSAVLKSISASPVLGVVGSTKDLQDVGKPTSKEEDRDYTGSLERIIARLSGAQDRGLATPGDVTAAGIELSLSRAIKDSNLEVFERFATESWTSERIRKLVLDRTLIELDSLLSGNTRGHVRMEAVDGKIQEAARAVYRRIFEVSELLAANRAANQFIQRLYQATSGRVDPKTLEVADTLVRRGSSPTLANYSLLLSRDDQGYTFNYRAQRIVYDCLSAHVQAIGQNEPPAAQGGEATPPSAETIEQRIKTISLAANGCDAWLATQFVDPVAKGAVKSQKPYPIRVVWSKDGPIEDPTMYIRRGS